MDEACAYAQLQLLHVFCPLVLFRGADSVREFEQICLVNPQHHRAKVDSSCENTPAKVQKFYETESHNAKKVAKRDENSFFEGQNGIKKPISQLIMWNKGTVRTGMTHSTMQ